MSGAVEAGHGWAVCHVCPRRGSGKERSAADEVPRCSDARRRHGAYRRSDRRQAAPAPPVARAQSRPLARRMGAAHPRDRARRPRPGRRSLHAPIPQPRDHLQFRRRLRPHRRQGGGATWNHRHQHAGRARRRGRRHCARPHAHGGAPAAAGGAISARRALAEGRLSAHRFAPGPDGRNHRARADRQGDRNPGQRLRARHCLPRPQSAGRRRLSLLSLARRDGQGLGHSHYRRPRRPLDAPYRQRRSARGFGAGRGADQYRPRLAGRREGADRGAAAPARSWPPASTSTTTSPTFPPS